MSNGRTRSRLGALGGGNTLAVILLGVVALGCVVGVIWIALQQPASTKTKTEPVTAPDSAAAAGGGSGRDRAPSAASQPPATTTTTQDKSSTALSVLATIASAAVGGIAGMLTAASRGDGSGRRREDELPGAEPPP